MTADTDEAVRVHLVNPGDIKIVRTEEVEPEHFITGVFPLPVTTLTSDPDDTGNVPVQILQLDPRRKKTVISVTGNGNAWFAHSQNQATWLARAVDQIAEGGFLITAPATFPVEGTAPLWAVVQQGSGTSGVQTPVAGTGTFTASGGSASLPVTGTTQFVTGFDVALGGVTAGPLIASVILSNVNNGPYTYYLDESAGGGILSVRYTTPVQAIGGAPTVTVGAVAGGASGNITVYGYNTAGTAPSLNVSILSQRRGS